MKNLAGTVAVEKDAEFDGKAPARVIAGIDVDATTDDWAVSSRRKIRHAAHVLRAEVAGNDGIGKRLTDEILAREAEKLEGSIIGMHDHARSVDRDNSIRKRRDQRAEECFVHGTDATQLRSVQ